MEFVWADNFLRYGTMRSDGFEPRPVASPYVRLCSCACPRLEEMSMQTDT